MELEIFNSKNRDNYLTWKEYAVQDSKSLYEAIVKAQEVYRDRFNVDVVNSVSASQLAYKLFTSKYCPIKLPTILRKDDNFLRKSYFGGAVDYYKASFVRGVEFSLVCVELFFNLIHGALSNKLEEFHLDNWRRIQRPLVLAAVPEGVSADEG